DPATFAQGFAAAAGFVDDLPHEHVVLGGFSQGAVMALSVGLGHGRPRPQAVIAFSGFLPEVEGWSLGGPPWPAIAIGHGTYDPGIPVEFAHRTRDRLVAARAPVENALQTVRPAVGVRSNAAEGAGRYARRAQPVAASKPTSERLALAASCTPQSAGARRSTPLTG